MNWRQVIYRSICTVATVAILLTGLSVLVVSDAAGSPQDDAASSTEADGPTAIEARPLFLGWPQPQLTLFITGRQNGYIEPCGCTGLENQKGGLARRQTLMKQLRDRGWDVLPIDVGNQVRRFGKQSEIKFHTTMNSLNRMKYEAVGLGPDDLRLSIGELLAEIGVDETSKSPLISANVNVLLGYKTHKIVQAGKFVVGITSFLGEKEQKAIESDEIEFRSAEDGVREAQAAMEKAKCQIMILLAHASTEESIAMVKKFPKFRIVVTAGGADEPALKPERIDGTDSYLIQTGKKGMHVGVLGIFPDTAEPIRFERVPLDARFRDSEEMLQDLASYQDQLKNMGLSELGLRPVKHPSGFAFVGSKACAECHEDAYEKWLTTPHHKATDSIAFPGERVNIPRHFDPECLSCHVTGWNPQGYFPYETGYLDFVKSKELHGNGCENCHGPGAGHIAAEKAGQDVEKYREMMQLPLEKARDHCLECHDLDNDPDFQKEEAFDEYWEQIEHYD